jgi:hypothetical protein
MPLQNRVNPLGELLAVADRGLVYANRGCLHDAQGRIRRRHNGKRWIACRLEFRGWQRGPMMQPGRFTELFFLDEATAFAAGHRPCALCRRADYRRFLELAGASGADEVDGRLHGERLGQRRAAALASLPEGAFVLRDGEPWLVLGERLLRWTPGGYTEREVRPGGSARATVITPPTLLEVLRSDWRGAVPLLHPSAGRGE